MPEQIGRLDPGYLDELLARLTAEQIKGKQDAKRKGRRR